MTAGGMRSDLKRLSEFMFNVGNDEADFTSTNSTENFMRGPKSRRLSPHFPLSHGIARVDDRRVVSSIIYVIRNGG